MSKIKVLAMYLPQFYQNEINDEWWGEGYTDWVAVKKAEKLVEGHNQPRVPLDNRYYNLLDKEAIAWQSELAKKYDVYGFCIYHYWFGNGSQALEKPAKNLLEWKDIDANYCFCWANTSWATTWDAIDSKNVWADKFEEKSRTKINDIIKKQLYGDEEEWKKHFEYLLPFFLDSRYIRVNNKPVFVINSSDKIPMLQPMIRLWNSLAKKNGLDGIYIIAESCGEYSKEISAMMQHEPIFSRTKVMSRNKVEAGKLMESDYDEVWQELLKASSVPDSGKAYYMAFTDFDSTPRKGMNGDKIKGVSVEKFEDYFKQLVEKSVEKNNELIFVNAWNEWGEGMYLEPDMTNGYGWLEAVKRVVNEYGEVKNKEEVHVMGHIPEKGRLVKMSGCLEGMLTILEKGKNISSYFKEKDVKNIAIYGHSVLARHLITQLKGSGINVAYVIDRKLKCQTEDYSILSLYEELPQVDMVVVTIVWDFNSIENVLIEKGLNNIVSLSTVIEKVENS